MDTASNTSTATATPEWTLADRLRKAREYAQLEQATLADRIGIGRTTISAYEHGTRTPKKPVIRSWAIECDVPYEWLSPDSSGQTAGYSGLLFREMAVA